MNQLLRISARFKTRQSVLFLILFLFSAIISAQAQQQLVWEENFDGSTINAKNWTYDLGDGCAQGVCGWGNSELETYTNRPENARVENGNLVIEARREAYQGKQFTSARLKTLGRVQFKYGTLEARIKVPNLKNGLWPAFWMLGATGTWPASGEIDIMEMGSAAAIAADLANRRVGGATHWENGGTRALYDTKYDSPTDLTTDYHVYRMAWDSQFIRMFIDDFEYYVIDISKAEAADLEEFHRAQFILLNMAVGGQYTGIYDPNAITAPLPAQMLVDYVRLYQSPGDELYLGNNPIAGDFGIYTENPAITNKLAYGTEANLYLWNNLTNITSPAPVPFEGTEVLALRAAAGNWFGFGVENQPKNLSGFANGSLKFNFKTTYGGQFKVGIKSGAGESWVDFPAGTARYGLVRDGQWHEIVIPMSAFGNGDLASVGQAFMFAGDVASAPADFYFDNIYYSGGVTANPAPTVAITSPTNEALIATPATITINATAADANGTVAKVDFYNGVTLLGTATTSPYSFTWSNVAAGTYSITAKATDNEGITTASAPVTVFVAAPNNTAPTISITSPTASATYTTPATVTIAAAATDADGSIYKVEFYNGSTLLGTDFTSPYSYTWANVVTGTYSLTAKTTDNGKLTATSAAVNLTVKDNTVTGTDFGIYTDNAQITNKLQFGQDANLFIWNGLAPIAGATPYEGPEVLALRGGPGNWFGFGIDNDVKNLASFAKGSLKLNFKTTYNGFFKIGIKSTAGESWVEFPAGSAQYGLVRDGQWHQLTIPFSAFANLDLSTLDQAFMFAGDAPAATADFYIDNIYYNAQEIVPPAVAYCATAANGDYSYAAATNGSDVTFTFHPLGSVAGGNLAILYVNGAGYTMVKNAAGDFTYTVRNQTSGAELKVYFTYQVGAGGSERNSAAAPHTYTVGTTCGAPPANVAPTVSLTSPAASASFNAPATITLSATAADTDGTISKVEFYNGAELLGTATSSPYNFSWEQVAVGTYSLTAKATANGGLATNSAAVSITVINADKDGDGYPADQDCDDNDPAVYPGRTFYVDADKDGFGDGNVASVTGCQAPAGYASKFGDCNDRDPAINPAAKDVCGLDRNCDGKVDLPAVPAPAITVALSSNEYTGGDGRTIYLGYGPQSATLTAAASQATSYSWAAAAGLTNTSAAKAVFTPTAAGSYTLTVIATNAASCTASAAVTITVIDVRGSKRDKIVLCHLGRTQEVPEKQVADYLKRGARLGTCEATPTASAVTAASTGDGAGKQLAAPGLSVYPNPTQGRTSLEIVTERDADYSLTVYDLKGALVKTIATGHALSRQSLSFEFNAEEYAEGVYVIKLLTNKELSTKRLVIKH